MTGSSTSNVPFSTGNDRIAGLEGNDVIDPGTDSDYVYADEGADTVIDTAAEDAPEGTGDFVYGDEGNDTINVRDPLPVGPRDEDKVYCGPGEKDRVFYDGGRDVVAKDCEIRRPG